MRVTPLALGFLALLAIGCLPDEDGDGFITSKDCNDQDASIHPGAEEVCDGKDNDCDGESDENPVEGNTLYADKDADSFGDASAPTVFCAESVSGFVDNGIDCDDSNPTAYPGAQEVCDLADNDCNLEVDDVDHGDETTGAAFWYPDADGDGYGAGDVSVWSCEAPADNYVDVTGDCDPFDEDVYPFATETCDGIDNDCDEGIDDADPDGLPADASEWFPDGDGDGWGANGVISCDPPDGDLASQGGDCDDTRREVHPDATELMQDGIDNNCDGDTDFIQLLFDDATMQGEADDDLVGRSVGGAGDVNGDGLADILVAAPGKGEAYLLYGPADPISSLSGADLVIMEEGMDIASSESVRTAGDVNADGFADFLVGASGHDEAVTNIGMAGLFYGSATGPYGAIDLVAADVTILGEDARDAAGMAVAGADFDQDGQSDVLISARLDVPLSDGLFYGTGAVYVMQNPLPSSISLPNGVATLMRGEAAHDHAGSSMSIGDVDADGRPDLLIGAPGSASGARTGRAYLLYGATLPTGEIALAANSDAVLEGAEAGSRAGYSVSTGGDVNGDGYDDILVGAFLMGLGNAGEAYLLEGPVTGVSSLVTASTARWTGLTDGDSIGYSVSLQQDVNKDNLADPIVCGYRLQGMGVDNGIAYVFGGPPGGRLSDADVLNVGETALPGSSKGMQVSGVGDTDGDAFDDFLLGTPGTWYGRGMLHVMSGFIL